MSKQAELWGSEFGNDYHARNPQKDRRGFWQGVIGDYSYRIKDVLEYGAGQGDNLAAIREIVKPDGLFLGLDVNMAACNAMSKRGLAAGHGDFKDFEVKPAFFDLVITRGFLIHLDGHPLRLAFKQIYESANKYICFAEYYSPKRRSISYHHYNDALWADDFAGKFMKLYPDVKIIKCGFDYHGMGGEDITYFLMQKGG